MYRLKTAVRELARLSNRVDRGVRRVSRRAIESARRLQRSLARFLASHRRARIATKIAVAAIIASAILSYPIIIAGVVFDDYEYIDDRAVCVSVYDQTGRWVGLLPNILEKDVTYQDWPSPDHYALAIDSVPDDFWTILKCLEDRHLGTHRSIYGIDILAFVRAATRDLISGRISGASSLSMQVVRSMRHVAPGTGEGFIHKIKRKALEVFHAPALYYTLGEEGLKRWAATHVPLIVGSSGSRFGGAVYGIELTSRICFGKSVNNCTIAEQALLAAAFSKPFLLKPMETGWQVSAERFEYLRSRAANGLRLAISDSTRLNNSISELEKMRAPEVILPKELINILPHDSSQRFRTFAHPVRRSLYLAGPELIETRGLIHHFGFWEYRPSAKAVTLTVDVARNTPFKKHLHDLLDTLWQNNSEKFKLPLKPDSANPEAASVLIAASEATTGIQYFYSNSQIPLLNPSRGSWLQVGSVGKVPLAIVFAHEGDSPKTQYCDMASGGHLNPGKRMGVAGPETPRSMHSATEVWARSMNLPLLWRANRESDSLAQALSARLGFVLPDDCRPSHSLVYGFATISPAELLNLFGELSLLLRPASDLTWTSASIVAEIKGQSRQLSLLSRTPDRTKEALMDYLDTDQARDFVEQVLSAPLKPGGSLQRLCDWTAERNSAVDLHLAKSGTVESAAGEGITLEVAGTIVIRDAHKIPHHWSYLVVVTSPSPSHPLATGTSAGGILTPIVRAVLNQIVKHQYHNIQSSNYTSKEDTT